MNTRPWPGWPQGDYGKPNKNSKKNYKGCSFEKPPIGFSRNNIFFLNKLNKVSDRLNDTIWPCFHRPEPVLNEGRYLPFCVDNKQRVKQNERKNEKECAQLSRL